MPIQYIFHLDIITHPITMSLTIVKMQILVTLFKHKQWPQKSAEWRVHNWLIASITGGEEVHASPSMIHFYTPACEQSIKLIPQPTTHSLFTFMENLRQQNDFPLVIQYWPSFPHPTAITFTIFISRTSARNISSSPSPLDQWVALNSL